MKHLITQERTNAPNAKYLSRSFPYGRIVGTSILLLIILLCSMQCAYAQNELAYQTVQLDSKQEAYPIKRHKVKVRFQGVPKDMTVPCAEPLPEWPEVKAIDHKGRNLVVVPTLQQSESEGEIQRKWTAITKKGKQASITQKISLEDAEAPSLSVPEDQTVLFQEGIPAPRYAAKDNCSETTVHLKESISIREDGNYNLLRTWTASDRQKNTISNSQNITIIVREVVSSD